MLRSTTSFARTAVRTSRAAKQAPLCAFSSHLSSPLRTGAPRLARAAQASAAAHLSPSRASSLPTASPATAKRASAFWKALGILPVANCEAPCPGTSAADAAAAATAEAVAGSADIAAAAAATAPSSNFLPPLPNLGLTPSYPGQTVQAAIDSVVDLHALTGLPWWGTIALATLIVRTATLPINVLQLRSTGRMMAAQPELQMFKARTDAARAAGEAVLPSVQALQVREIFNKHKASPFGAIGYAVLSMPVFFSLFWVFRALVLHPDLIPMLQTGGPEWLAGRWADLTRSDPTYVAPAISTLTVVLMLEMAQKENQSKAPMAKVMKNIMRVVSVISFPLICNFPLGLFMFWIPSNLYSLGFSIASRTDTLRNALKIPTMSQIRMLAAQNESASTARVTESVVEQARTRAIAAADANKTAVPAQVFVPGRPKKGARPAKF